MTAGPASIASAEAAARHRLGLGLVTLSTLCWSTAGYFTRLIPLDSWTMLFWRGIFGALAGLAFVLWQERRGTVRAFTRMGHRGVIFCVISSASMVCFLISLKLTTVAHVSIIYATVPFLAAGLAWMAMREHVSRATLIASLAAIAGVAVAVGGGLDQGDVTGDLLALLMTVLLAAMIVLQRANGTIDMVPAACASALLTAAVSLPLARPLDVTAMDLLNLAVFGITNMGLGLILFTIGSRLIPAAQTALIGALDAPLAMVWVWLAFSETPNGATILGGAVVMAAVIGHIVVEQRQASRRRASV